MGSASATLSHCHWLRSRCLWTEGRRKVQGRREDMLPNLLQTYHSFSPLPGPFYTHSRFSIDRILLRNYRGALSICKSQNPPLYTYWPICLAFQPQFSTLKPYPANGLISRREIRMRNSIFFSVLVNWVWEICLKKHWDTCNYSQCVSSSYCQYR